MLAYRTASPRLCPNCETPLNRKQRRFCSQSCYHLFVMRDPIARFWEKVEVTPGCWIWTASRQASGYGKFNHTGDMVGAHQFSYWCFFGRPPAGMQVCHTCDNPPCVRPDHLFAGTSQENMHDRQAKGRTTAGSRCHSAKLTEAQVLAIRAIPEGSMTQAQLAEQFGVRRNAIARVRKHDTWRTVRLP